MKNILLLFISVLGMSFNVFAQITIDANGNYNDNNLKITSVKSLFVSAKTASNPPVIINTIPSPTTYPSDIAFDGMHLWVEGYGGFLLYKISPVDGSIIKTIPSNIMRPYGLEFANGCLWVADADNNLIQQVDTSNGNVISSFPTPSLAGSSYPQGLAWDGQNLWHNDAMSPSANNYDSTYKITTTGQVIESHHAFGSYVTGLAWDGQYLWSSDNGNVVIYKIDVSSFTVIDTINAPGGPFPNGLTFDGQYLWVSNNQSDSLYQLDIGNTSSGLPQNNLTGSDFLLYPNPTGNEITIESSDNKVGSNYFITDQTGREIFNGKITDKKTIIDIEQLAAGMYFFQVGDKRKQSFKVMKK